MFLKSIAELEEGKESHQPMTEEKGLGKDRQWVEGGLSLGRGTRR